MTSQSPRLPAPINALTSRLPAYPGSVLFVTGLNTLLLRHLPADTLLALQGRLLRIRVIDAGIELDFTYAEKAFKAARHREDVDLTIAASVHDFLCLIQRDEDPDTLFFSRRLVMEGDTELGLMVKNTLDALDMSSLSVSRFLPALKGLQHVLR